MVTKPPPPPSRRRSSSIIESQGISKQYESSLDNSIESQNFNNITCPVVKRHIYPSGKVYGSRYILDDSRIKGDMLNFYRQNLSDYAKKEDFEACMITKEIIKDLQS